VAEILLDMGRANQSALHGIAEGVGGGGGAVPVTVAEALWAGLAWLVAVTVTVVLAPTSGAVNSPELETDPPVAVPSDAVFVEPVTVAVNC